MELIKFSKLYLVGLACKLRESDFKISEQQLKILHLIVHNEQSENNLYYGEWNLDLKKKIIDLFNEIIPENEKKKFYNIKKIQEELNVWNQSYDLAIQEKKTNIDLYNKSKIRLNKLETECINLKASINNLCENLKVASETEKIVAENLGKQISEKDDIIKKILEDNVFRNEKQRIIKNERIMKKFYQINTQYINISDCIECFKKNILLNEINSNIYSINILKIQLKNIINTKDFSIINFKNKKICKPFYLEIEYKILQDISKREHRLILNLLYKIIENFIICYIFKEPILKTKQGQKLDLINSQTIKSKNEIKNSIQDTSEKRLILNVEIPKSKVGKVIGRKGNNIKNIISKVGNNVKISYDNQKYFVISAYNQNDIEFAKTLIIQLSK